jgi:hypothetical protein
VVDAWLKMIDRGFADEYKKQQTRYLRAGEWLDDAEAALGE